MKEKFKKLKEIWANKRYRAIIILALYAIFFVFCFIYINSFKEEKPISDNYTKYYYVINNEITVKDFKITYNGKTYSKNDFKEYNFALKLEDINNLIKNGTLESQNYILNTLTYIVSVEEYNKLLENKLNTDENIKIVVYKKHDKTTKINCDFSLVYGYPYTVDYIME